VNPISLKRRILEYNQAYFLSQDNLLPRDSALLSPQGAAPTIKERRVEGSYGSFLNKGTLLAKASSLLPSKDSLMLDNTLTATTKRLLSDPAAVGDVQAMGRGRPPRHTGHAGTLAASSNRTKVAATAAVASGGRRLVNLRRAQSIEGELWSSADM
jgi:hypothetical protein